MSYHLTTSISALNINKYGMDPSKKEADVLEDINMLIDSLSEDKVKYFFPFVLFSDFLNDFSIYYTFPLPYQCSII